MVLLFSGADGVCNEFVALSAVCDKATASCIIAHGVSKGVIAPGFNKDAIIILAKIRNYCVLEVRRSTLK